MTLHPSDFICPRCGLVCPSLAAYHQHYAKAHESPTYKSGCPILEEGGKESK